MLIMKKFFIYIFLIYIFNLYSIEKPILSTGINSNSNFNILEDKISLYPSSIMDNLYLSVEEKFSGIFRARYRFDFYFYNYNKYSLDLDELKAYIIHNSISLFFNINPNNEFQLYIQPSYYYKSGINYMNFFNKLQYKYNSKNFVFKIYYSHTFETRIKSVFFHNIAINLYWSNPKYDFIKYRSTLSVYFQHFLGRNEDIISPIKSAKFKFEMIINFNELNLEDTFDKNNEDNDFFEDLS